MKSRENESYRPFWITFFSTLLILGSIVALSFYMISNHTTEAAQQNTKVPVSPYIPKASDSRNVLLIGCPERGQEPTLYLLLRFDAVANRCYILSVPPQVQSTVNVKTMTLAGHYDYGSSEYAVNAVENLFLTRIHQYIRFDSSSLAEVVDFFGGIEYELDHEISTENYQFESGKQLLDGARVSALMLNGDTTLSASLMNCFMETHFNETMETKQSKFFSIIFNKCDTELTSLQLKNSNEMLKNLYSNQEDKTEILVLDGEFSDEDSEIQFEPSEEAMKELKEILAQ